MGNHNLPEATVRERNEQRIFDAAESVFARHGYRGASIQAIAAAAGLPKSNVLYYVGSKRRLYITLLERTMWRWNEMLSDISADDDPAEVLEAFIRSKMRLSQTHPQSSRLFASEILQGAPFLKESLFGDMREWVESRTQVFREWAERGLMDPVDPVWLIFLIWSATQHYADFETQIVGITQREALDAEDFQSASDFLCQVILKGCGVRRRDASTP
ncbi:TetR family transcriptional regulator C-terminal domain-containing protein [Salinicola salarius]|uniref:TetR family transcriptional regulator C-terminal domain-containing protein n=1 Tax=Salinicola salarius TaxID=430457 RepID=UPI0023E3CA8B|nr:TetR family transcriptional regulator C-terminal domain-containing protein [Salinicola salarius]MDF3917343.1 TetR family transcriptional regulator C-terminal domain-containing protein [Salinicola salarius]